MNTQAQLLQAIAARESGDYDEALRLNLSMHEAPPPDEPGERNILLFSLYEWALLAQEYPAARTALLALRSRELAQLASDTQRRFQLIAEINRHLGDASATVALFRQLETKLPDAASRAFHGIADVLLDEGAVDVLQRHLPEPHEGMHYRAQYLDAMAGERLPRRLGEAQSFVGMLQLQCGVLTLLGKTSEAAALMEAALGQIKTEEARALVRRELEQPGAIAALMQDWHRNQGAPSDFRQ